MTQAFVYIFAAAERVLAQPHRLGWDTSRHLDSNTGRRHPRICLRLQAVLPDTVFLSIVFVLSAAFVGPRYPRVRAGPWQIG